MAEIEPTVELETVSGTLIIPKGVTEVIECWGGGAGFSTSSTPGGPDNNYGGDGSGALGGYIVERAEEDGDFETLIEIDDLETLSYDDEDVEEGVTYHYRIMQITGVEESAWSDVATICYSLFPQMLVGVNGVNCKIVDGYIGINGSNRKIIKLSAGTDRGE